MINLSMKNALVQLIYQSDWVSKFVILVLFFMSIACWAISFYKIFMLRSKNKQLDRGLDFLDSVNSFDELVREAPSLKYTIAGDLLTNYLQLLKSALQRSDKLGEISEKDAEYLQFTVDQNLDEIIHEQESYLNVLIISGAVATLLGLFGTIWGLIHSFVFYKRFKNSRYCGSSAWDCRSISNNTCRINRCHSCHCNVSLY